MARYEARSCTESARVPQVSSLGLTALGSHMRLFPGVCAESLVVECIIQHSKLKLTSPGSLFVA
eukprot:1106890-Pleurochrysis_carterae.AAC.1